MSDKHLLNDNYKKVYRQARQYFEKVDSHQDTEVDADYFYTDALLTYGEAEYMRGLNHHADIMNDKGIDFKCFLEENQSLRDYVAKLIEKNSRLYATREDLLEKLSSQFMSYHKLAQKSEWHDAEKCLPKQGRKVIGELESQDANRLKVQHEGELMIIDGVAMICYQGIVQNNDFGQKFTGPYKTIKWRYADE